MNASLATADITHGLTEQQRAAFKELHRFALGNTDSAMAVLRGFAGTGKTYLISRLIHALGGSGMSIAVAAPTNKAVRVLRDKIIESGIEMPSESIDGKDRRQAGPSHWIEFGSIHSLLGLQLTDREDGTQECKSARDPSLHEYDLAIIDECSMIGSDLFSRIVVAKRRCLILFVGDPAQLPPIEPNEAISPAFSKVSFEVTLNNVVRQARDNPIIKLSLLLRQAIEAERRIDTASIQSVLPPLDTHPSAALIGGGPETILNIALYEIQSGRDARVLAYTNPTVISYNHAIHEALHGRTEFPFVPGEPVIAHSACDAFVLDDSDQPTGIKTGIITSEEAIVREVKEARHPYWSNVPSASVILERDNGMRMMVYVALKSSELERAISEQFSVWRRLKGEADAAYQSGQPKHGRALSDEAKAASSQAWSMRKAFAPLRHAYALTAHKSQGSTFDTALVDLNDMAKMRSAFQFNRGLYVAITRPRQYLAIVA